MPSRWTTPRRAQALEDGDCEINLNHGIDKRRFNASVVESAIHEIAHAVVLGPSYERRRRGFSDAISNAIHRLYKRRSHLLTFAWIWQEIMALAVQVLMLKKLRLPYHRQVVYSNEEADTVFEHRVFCRLVERATKTKATRRRVHRAMRLLNQLCKEGEHDGVSK